MKKTILSFATVALLALGANAQESCSSNSVLENIKVITTYTAPADGADMELSNLTDRIGFLYQVADNCSVGLVKNGEDYNLISRYHYTDKIFISVQAPFEDLVDNASIGLGYSLGVWKSFSVEPNYTLPVSTDDDGNREGTFNLSLSYKF